jgi:hypothetical protein
MAAKSSPSWCCQGYVLLPRSAPCLYNPCPEIYAEEMQWVVLEERRMDFKKFFKTETAELADFGIIAASIPSLPHVSSSMVHGGYGYLMCKF